jgi:RNAse (barnase) inhibitor barstar
LYAYCLDATTKQQVLAKIAASFGFPKHFGKNFDALYDCLTDMIHQAGPQPGFVIVLEQLPNTPKFDKEAREILLDVFRDAAEFWAEKKLLSGYFIHLNSHADVAIIKMPAFMTGIFILESVP